MNNWWFESYLHVCLDDLDVHDSLDDLDVLDGLNGLDDLNVHDDLDVLDGLDGLEVVRLLVRLLERLLERLLRWMRFDVIPFFKIRFSSWIRDFGATPPYWRQRS